MDIILGLTLVWLAVGILSGMFIVTLVWFKSERYQKHKAAIETVRLKRAEYYRASRELERDALRLITAIEARGKLGQGWDMTEREVIMSIQVINRFRRGGHITKRLEQQLDKLDVLSKECNH